MTEPTLDVTRYTYRVTWSVEDDQYVATCVELPSLSWLAATQEDALGGLRDLVAEVVRDMTDTGEPVPEPLSSRSYSGKFNLRVGEQLHRRLAVEAAEEHLSLNQYVVRRLSDASCRPALGRADGTPQLAGEAGAVARRRRHPRGAMRAGRPCGGTVTLSPGSTRPSCRST